MKILLFLIKLRRMPIDPTTNIITPSTTNSAEISATFILKYIQIYQFHVRSMRIRDRDLKGMNPLNFII